MSKAYRDFWNPEVQAKIDRDIELFRKANATIELDGISQGTEVRVEQTGHSFILGATLKLRKLSNSDRF